MNRATAPSRVWPAVMVFVVTTAVLTVPLLWWQLRAELPWWAFNLPALAPFAAGWVTIALRRPLGLAVDWRPGFGFSTQVVRRSVLAVGVALAVLFVCVQFYGFFRWKLKPQLLADLLHPLAMPGDVPTIFLLVLAGLVVVAVLEEFGWRTVLEPTLRQRLGMLPTAIVVGLVWGAWQWPAWLGLLHRQQSAPSLLQAVLFIGSHFVASISISLLLVLVHAGMRQGQWLSAVCLRVVVDTGFFLVLDEEDGRWQAMFAIGVSCALVAAVGYYYTVRGVRARLADRT